MTVYSFSEKIKYPLPLQSKQKKLQQKCVANNKIKKRWQIYIDVIAISQVTTKSHISGEIKKTF